jgi:hypothetical protein
MRHGFGIIAALAVSAVALSNGAAEARTESWLHNGARLSWISILEWRQVIKYVPASEPARAHRDPAGGAVLFSGWRYGKRLYGRARTYRDGCSTPFSYRVRGLISNDGTRAVLQGMSPVVEDCRVVDWRPFGRDATLVLIKSR